MLSATWNLFFLISMTGSTMLFLALQAHRRRDD